MTWLYLSILSAVLLTMATLAEKKGLMSEHAMEFSAVFSVAVAILGLSLLFKVSSFNIPSVVWLYSILNALLSSLSFFLWAKAARHMQVSSSTPFLGLTPAVTVILSHLFLGEHFSSLQVAGIALMVVGTYALQGSVERVGEITKINVFKSKFIWFIFVSLTLYSFGAIFDKVVLSQYHVDLFLYLVITQVFIALITVFMLYIFHDGLKGLENGFLKYGWIIFAAAILTIGQRLAYLQAASLASIGLVVAIKRSSVLFSTLVGGEVFHEKDVLRKSFSCVVIIAGVFMIIWQ